MLFGKAVWLVPPQEQFWLELQGGDRAIATEEVLGGAGVGALAGFLLGGNDKKELISIDTQRDLNLILGANLVVY